MVTMKQFEPKVKKIAENTFYIRPFAALTAANISGELGAISAPVLAALSPLALNAKGSASLMDVNVDEAAPVISDAFACLSGDKIERLMRKLLIVHKNISVETPDSDKAVLLTEDLLNEIFCGDVQNMFILAAAVISTNYNGFFESLGSRFGTALVQKATVQPSMSNLAGSI